MKHFYDLFEAKKIEREINGVGVRKNCKSCGITFHWDYVKVFPRRDQFCSVKCAFNNFIENASLQ